MRHAGLIVLCLAVGGPAGAEWFAYRDADGALHVTDQLSSPTVASVAVKTLEYGTSAEAPGTDRPSATRPDAVEDPPHAPAAPDATPASAGGDAAADKQRRLAARLRSNLAHLALLRTSPNGGTGRAALENDLTDAVRADRAALAALRGVATDPAE